MHFVVCLHFSLYLVRDVYADRQTMIIPIKRRLFKDEEAAKWKGEEREGRKRRGKEKKWDSEKKEGEENRRGRRKVITGKGEKKEESDEKD